MKDVITYCADKGSLIAELRSVYKTADDEPVTLDVIKTPVIYKDGHSLSLVRVLTDEDQQKLNLNNLEILGTYDEVFSDPAKMALYESVYSTQPYEVEDEDGTKQTITPPKKFGVFYD